MAKIRVYDLAKEIGVSNKELLGLLETIGVTGKVPSSSIEETAAQALRQLITNKNNPKPEVNEEEAAKAEQPKSFGDFDPSEFRAQHQAEETPVASDHLEDFRDDDLTAAPQVDMAAASAPKPKLSVAQRRPFGPARRGSPRGRGKDFREERGRRSSQEEMPAPVKKEDELPPEGTVIAISPQITVGELAAKLKKSPAELIKKLFSMSIIRAANQPLEADVVSAVAAQYGYSIEVEKSRAEIELEEAQGEMVHVPPSVTVMGHVDHGKTSLLDVIRSANVQSGEAGGITQRIGAYETEHNGHTIVFLDTPGHEAFTRMRARGAHVTDIAVLVVAADDGVMPQTKEAIDHARAAKVPLLVALNKMDRPGADPDRVKGQLAEAGLIPEDYGGDVVVIPVSAKTGQGVVDLLDMILLMAEMQELVATKQGPATGTILEAQQDQQRGSVATVLIHSGTLHVGDHVVVGDVHGRVRAMYDYKGDSLESAGPKKPVSLIGLSAVPHASDTLRVVKSSKIAREQAAQFAAEAKSGQHAGAGHISLEELFAQIKDGNVKELNVVVKADGQGSVEALCSSLAQLAHEEVRVKIVSRGVGNVSESDIMLASASNAIVIAFDVNMDNTATSLADRENVQVRKYNVIYDAIDDVKAALEGMLAPTFEEKKVGEAEVLATFKSAKAGTIAGCRVIDGKMVQGGIVRIMRGDNQLHEGTIDTLRHGKQDIKDIAAPGECGISMKGFDRFEEGDHLHCYVRHQVKRTI